MQQMVRSPVTGGPAWLCDVVRSNDLIGRYRYDWGLDVASHFDGLSSLSVYQCEDTGYRFFHPASLAGESSFYDQFWALENPTIHRPKGAWRDDWQFALDRIRASDKVLDVGAADGAFIERAGQIAQAEGIDENDAGCRLAQRNGLTVTCTTVSEFANSHPATFDLVIASQVLEHVYGVAQFMRALKQLTRSGGRIILSVPNNQPYYAGWTKYDPLNNPPHHIGLWNERSLRKMARHVDLQVEEVAYLGKPDRFALQVFRRAAHLADVTRAPKQLTRADWIRIGLRTPLATILTMMERLAGSTCNFAYVAVVLRKADDSRQGAPSPIMRSK
jgi:SAM-dependent methyltransferase